MKKLLCYLILPLLGLTLLIGCKDKDDPKSKDSCTSLVGEWKLKGFGNSADNTLREPEAQYNCDTCFIFEFRKDKTAGGRSIANYTAWSPYQCDGNKFSFPEGIIQTLIHEPHQDGRTFLNAMNEISRISSPNDQLKLFYSETEYLLFNRKK